MRELQVELGECKVRKETLEEMLAQMERKLIGFQEQHRALHAERSGLKDELQHLKTEHLKTLKDAEQQAQKTKVNTEAYSEYFSNSLSHFFHNIS